MKLHHLLFAALAVWTSSLFAQTSSDLLIIGSDHLNQLYRKEFPATDVLLPKRQKEVSQFNNLLLRYKPDVVMVEVLPEEQHTIDSLYTLYLQGQLELSQLPDGRSEVYQIAFAISKQLKLPRVYCVNAPGGTSQGILDNGDNIEIYRKEGQDLRAIVTAKVRALQKDSLSFKDYLIFINQPSTIRQIHHLRYITPARVTNGKFKNPDAMVDTAFINPRYIGAELTSIFKNRDYKIYSNIIRTQQKTGAKKILLLIGAAHIGSLKSILRDDETFRLVEATKYLHK